MSPHGPAYGMGKIPNIVLIVAYTLIGSGVYRPSVPMAAGQGVAGAGRLRRIRPR